MKKVHTGKRATVAARGLLAAASALGISLGFTVDSAANAADQSGSNQIKLESKQHKLGSTQLKLESQQQKMGSTQIKGMSVQHKVGSTQIKGQSQQIKIESNQIKVGHD